MNKTIPALLLLLIAAALAHAAQAVGDWSKFTSDEGHFSVLLPSKPEETKDTKDSPIGPYTVHLFTSKSASEIFLVGWVDYDPKFHFDDQKEMEANRDNLVQSLKAKVLDTKQIKLDDYAGIEFTAENEQVAIRSRVYIVGRRPYQLIAVHFKPTPESADVDRFFSSFEVAPVK